MVVGAARRGLLDKTGLESSSQNNEYRTVHTDSYGPSNSDVIMKERVKKLSALDECVTKNWTTTQDAIGCSALQQVEGKADAKAAMCQKRSKISYQTYRPWSTTYDQISTTAQANMVPRKKAEQQKKVFFPESIDYVTTQGDYGKEFHDYRNERRSRSARPLKEASLDIYHTSTSSIGNQYKEFALNPRAKTMEIQEQIVRRQSAPVEDVLGRVDINKEDQLYQLAATNDYQKEVNSRIFHGFMVSDCDKPPPVLKEGRPLDNLGFPKATSYKIRKGLRELNINPEDL